MFRFIFGTKTNPHFRRVNSGPTTRDTVRKSYEFALSHVGQDKDSGEIWNDYIQFLNSGETSTTWEQQQKMDALRKVYHRAVQIPLDNVERLWQELETFETNLNKITAKKFMSDLSQAHMQARSVLRLLTSHLGPLFPPSSAVKPELYLPTLPTFSHEERVLVGRWKNYLKWEESNPLEIEDKDKSTFITRVQGVYRKAVIRMRYYPEIWCVLFYPPSLSPLMGFPQVHGLRLDQQHREARGSSRHPQGGLGGEPIQVRVHPLLRHCHSWFSFSFLLTFAYAELQESKKEYKDVHDTFEKLLAALHTEIKTLEAKISPAPSSDAIDPAQGHVANNANNNAVDNAANNAVNGSYLQDPSGSKDNSFDSQSSDEKPSDASELIERKRDLGMAYVFYMRFGRRAEGVAMSRKIFGRARKDNYIPWQVYEAAGMSTFLLFSSCIFLTLLLSVDGVSLFWRQGCS